MSISNGLNVLIVDDEEIVRHTLHGFVDFLGHHADCVENGPSGLKALESGDYHAAIVDIRMPGLDGNHFFASSKGYAAGYTHHSDHRTRDGRSSGRSYEGRCLRFSVQTLSIR